MQSFRKIIPVHVKGRIREGLCLVNSMHITSSRLPRVREEKSKGKSQKAEVWKNDRFPLLRFAFCLLTFDL